MPSENKLLNLNLQADGWADQDFRLRIVHNRTADYKDCTDQDCSQNFKFVGVLELPYIKPHFKEKFKQITLQAATIPVLVQDKVSISYSVT